MAGLAITSGGTSLGSSGLNSLLTFFLAAFRSQKRNVNRPINYCNAQASELFAEEGQTVTIPLYPTTGSQLTTDGQSVDYDDNVGSATSITLNKHRTHRFSMTQIAQALDGNKVMDGLMIGRINGVLNDIEADVLSIVTTGFTTNVVGTYGSAMTEANNTAAMVAYWDQKPPESDFPVSLVRHDANAWGALYQLAAFRDFQVMGKESFSSGSQQYIGGVDRAGMRWVPTQALPKNGTSIDNLVFHRNALCVAFRSLQQPLSSGVQARNEVMDGISFQILLQWNGDQLADEFVIHSLYGYAVGKEQWGVLYKS